MNQPTRGLPACLDLLEQCLFGQMSIYFSWREEGARADQGRHCVQHAAPRSLCTSRFLNGAGDCDVSKNCLAAALFVVLVTSWGHPGEDKRH